MKSNKTKNLCNNCVKNELCYFTCKQRQYDGIVSSCNDYEKIKSTFSKIRKMLNDSSDVIQFFTILLLFVTAISVLLYALSQLHQYR